MTEQEKIRIANRLLQSFSIECTWNGYEFVCLEANTKSIVGCVQASYMYMSRASFSGVEGFFECLRDEISYFKHGFNQQSCHITQDSISKDGTFIKNPYLGCKTFEEMLIRKDLLY